MSPALVQWLKPDPSSMIERSRARGRTPWMDGVHLLWSVWIFIVPLFNHGFDMRWLGFTLATYPIFLLFYYKCLSSARGAQEVFALALVALCMATLPWYPSGLTYFIYGCVMLGGCYRNMRVYLLWVVTLNVFVITECVYLGFSWPSYVSIPLTTLIIGVTVNAERSSDEKDAELKLSHDEVRRLAATAERERIGRDLHDLLGHTLSLITLKLELARKLRERGQEQAAAREADEAERVARHALAEVRAAVTGIRSTDMAAELASARLLLESSGVRLDYETLPADVPQQVERTLALVLRESATNIARHARATQAWVKVQVDGPQLTLCIADNGRGGLGDEGNGLCGLRERVAGIHGELGIVSARGKGTRLTIRVDLRRFAARELPASDQEQAA
ncbi:sensor histidine kinase [Oleiagrimonas sp. C23AA]|uniref:sensor histidine kinase n=1 Tax=Oleiagrimonas sp. C23AA TaxID=2719047 RepID=UPI00141E54BF|nr:sensor histidine kinase [Oleiagrimonas sp. C23AA]NII09129.1 sensor histidine kinase [Oleiagrimonas sp. C23AA]